MRLKSFVIAEMYGPSGGRGKFIKKDEAISIINSKCKKARDEYVKSGDCLYRGMKSGDFYKIDPTSSPRRSQFTDNFYTLIMDNDSRWKKFPKRSESLICTTNRYKANAYGNNVMRVFPYDGASYGVCPEDDIWMGFQNTMGHMSLSDANGILKHLHDSMEFKTSMDKVDTYKELMAEINRISHRLDTTKIMKKEDEDYMLPFMIAINAFVDRWQWEGSFKDWYLKLFNPTVNDFFQTNNLKKVFSTGVKNKEIWTDSKAIMIADYLKEDFFK
jgi:hypothetical protein